MTATNINNVELGVGANAEVPEFSFLLVILVSLGITRKVRRKKKFSIGHDNFEKYEKCSSPRNLLNRITNSLLITVSSSLGKLQRIFLGIRPGRSSLHLRKSSRLFDYRDETDRLGLVLLRHFQHAKAVSGKARFLPQFLARLHELVCICQKRLIFNRPTHALVSLHSIYRR